MSSPKNKLYLALLLLIIGTFCTPVFAQSVSSLTDQQITNFIQQAQASGMTEAQIEAAATARGISPADIALMRDRIANLKKGNQATNKTNNNTVRRQMGDAEPDSLYKDLWRFDSLSKKKDSLQKSKPKIFGMNIFQNKKLTFEPNLRLPTPKNYILGTEDELNVNISGYASQSYTLKISPEGNIRIENLGPIFVSGSTIEQARERIINRLKAIVPGLSTGNSSVDVTLGNVRSIKVMIIGEVKNPGTYTVSSLATAFNALYICGGLSDNGSLREIEVYRNGKIIRKIDVYDFLLRGDQRDNIALFDQDVIRVPYYETHVELSGGVKSPMIFEVKKGETFKTVLDFAGGFIDSAYTKAVNVIRITPTEKKILTVEQNEFNTFLPQKGDKFIIGTVLDRFENKVNISGAVFREGNYELEKDLTLTQLIKKAEGLKEDAFQERVLIKRQRENLDPELVTVDVARVYKNEIPDIRLKREDSVFIIKYSELRERRTVTINGSVNKIGIYNYVENMNVGDLVALAGGFTDGASATKIEIARRIREAKGDLKSGKTIETIIININRDLKLSVEETKVTLQPFDKIFVRQLPRYEDQKIVTIKGEIVYAGPYAIEDKTERISDLIKKAGGLKNEADLKAAMFSHNGKVLSVNLAEVLDNPKSENNLLLYPNDVLDIPRKKETITISGQVMNPVTIAYQSKLKFKDYIDNAGGYTDSAKISKVYVRYANGSILKTKHFLFFAQYPPIEQGMGIIVPQKRRGTQLTMAERIAIGTGLTSFSTAIILLINYLKK